LPVPFYRQDYPKANLFNVREESAGEEGVLGAVRRDDGAGAGLDAHHHIQKPGDLILHSLFNISMVMWLRGFNYPLPCILLFANPWCKQDSLNFIAFSSHDHE